MPRLLVIDTATPACSVALFEDGHMLAGDYRLLGRGHAEHVVAMIAALPDNGKAQQIMVNCGPGSFTGIRVGLAAAKALGMAWNAKITGYNCLQLSAIMVSGQNAAQTEQHHDNTDIFIANIAGHGELFGQLFDAHGQPLSPLWTLPPEQMKPLVTADIIEGTGVAMLNSEHAVTLHPDARAFPADTPNIITQLPVTPIYGRAPDAVPAIQK